MVEQDLGFHKFCIVVVEQGLNDTLINACVEIAFSTFEDTSLDPWSWPVSSAMARDVHMNMNTGP
jgi:hypothetical protein